MAFKITVEKTETGRFTADIEGPRRELVTALAYIIDRVSEENSEIRREIQIQIGTILAELDNKKKK